MKFSHFFTVLLVLITSAVQAQRVFHEGVLTYKADTIGRSEPYPSAQVVTQIQVYKKGKHLRIEKDLVDVRDRSESQQHVFISNDTGVFTFIKFPPSAVSAYFATPDTASAMQDSMAALLFNFVVFSTHEEFDREQQERKRSLKDSGYQLVRSLQSFKKWGLKAEKVEVRDQKTNTTSEAVLTKAFTIPLGYMINSLVHLPGTPLEFTDRDSGWLYRYTATSLTSEKVSDQRFKIDPKMRVMTTEEMMKDFANFK